MSNRKASIKETGEELSPEDWARFEAAVRQDRAERSRGDHVGIETLGRSLTLQDMMDLDRGRRV